ncbi:MAG TPA: hypothetical protein VNB64_06910, partial [Solirubrobacteraceae bacterium]|nr:hypothetical protein [Solirubrobacteraceae bacterium]
MKDYLLGIVLLGVVAGGCGLAAVGVRARLAPGATGALSRLIEVVVAVGVLTVTSQALAAAAVFREATVVLVAVLAGLGGVL